MTQFIMNIRLSYINPYSKILNSIGFNVFNADIVNAQGGSLKFIAVNLKK